MRAGLERLKIHRERFFTVVIDAVLRVEEFPLPAVDGVFEIADETEIVARKAGERVAGERAVPADCAAIESVELREVPGQGL